MTSAWIPAVDSFPIPGPHWLFHVLLVFTFFLHMLFLNITLGGTLMAAVAQLASGGRPGDPRTVLAGRLMAVNTYGISLTITTGIAPLLFVQVLYQQFFYTATILISWVWLFLLIFLMAGYYTAYLYKFKGTPTMGSGGTGWLLVAALLFLVVAMIHVAVNLVHSQPETWATVAANPWVVLGDPAYWPRLLHFVLASLGLSGLIVAWWANREVAKGSDVDLNRRIAVHGWRWTLWTTVLLVVDGFLLLFVLPSPVLSGLMKGGAATLVPLTVSILLAVGLVVMLARVQDPTAKPALVTGTLAVMVSAIGIMAITRHQVRVLYLDPATTQFQIAAAPQWGNFLLFAGLLLAGLYTVFAMVRRVLDSATTGSEAA
jgi:hypothetical protein